MNVIGQPKLLRKLNQSTILSVIREHGPMSQADISRILGISSGAVSHIVRDLLQQKRIIEAGRGVSRGGRRSVLLQFNPRFESAVGVEMGARRQIAVLTDLDGDVIEQRQAVLDEPSQALEVISRMIDELLAESHNIGLPVRGVGVGVPGSVETSTGIVNFARAFGWHRFPLRDWLQDRFSVPVCVDNDVNMAVLGEMWRGVGKGLRNLVMIVAATGIGAGIVINGELYRGASDAAGEIGYMAVSPDCLSGNYTNWGFLEGLIGQGAVIGRATVQQSEKAKELVSGDQFYLALRQDNAFSSDIVREICDYLSMAVANTIALLNPELVIMGGYIAEAPDLFIEPISARVRRLVPVPCEIVVPGLGEKSTAIGAVAAVLNATTHVISVRGA
jgi:predicted NBD/HSP70 family sugar kinase